MHFAFSEEQELLRSTTRKFLDQRQPISALRATLESDITMDRAVWSDGAALGWTALLVPEAHDGGSVTDQPLVDLAGVAEELGRGLYPGPVLETNVVADAIVASGSTEQQARFLASIARGETIATLAISADGTTDPRSVGVTAAITDGTVTLDGRASFVRDAHIADLVLVVARTPDGPTFVLVPLPTDGVSCRVMKGLDLTRRVCAVTFDGVQVGTDAIVGAAGGAQQAIDRALRLATVLQAAQSTGASERLMEITVQYAKDRVQFGRAIGSFQAIKHRLADMHVCVEALRAAARHAALAVADDADDRDEAVAVAGSYVRETTSFVCGESLQLHGGIGFTWEHDVHLFLRRAKADQGLYGDPYSHRERLCSLVEQRLRDTADATIGAN